MKIILVSIGTVKESALKQLLERYTGRIPYYMPFEHIILPDVKASRSLTPEIQKCKEGEMLLSKVEKGDYLVLFDERGKQLTSRELATFIDRKANTMQRNLIFVIGGPYGFSEAVYARADMLLSLSKMTFTHEMAIVLAAEQLYRAQTILRGEPYHHD